VIPVVRVALGVAVGTPAGAAVVSSHSTRKDRIHQIVNNEVRFILMMITLIQSISL